MPLDQFRLPRRRHADGDIGLAHGKIELAVLQHQIHLDIRIKIDEFEQHRRQPGRAEGLGRRHLQLALGPVLGFRQLRLGHGELREHFMGGAIEQLALFGQDEAAGMAVEEGDVEAFLQRRDLARDRGLAEIQHLTRMGEASRPRPRRGRF